ncbi:MAG: VanZ family protein [Gammaproteobacteria bacterium]
MHKSTHIFQLLLCNHIVTEAKSGTSAKNKTLRKKEVVVVLTVIILYGISDGFHQSFVLGRQLSWYDVLADGVGGLLAWALGVRTSAPTEKQHELCMT